MSFVPEEISFIVSSDENQGAINKSANGDYFEIQLDDGLKIPKTAINVNVKVEESTIWWVIPNIITGTNDTMYIFGDSDDLVPVPQLYTVVIPQGLYDLTGLNNSILSGLEALGARTEDGSGNPLPLISMSADDATQKVLLRLNYTNTYVDFNQSNTPRDILGFDALPQIGPDIGAPLNIPAANEAGFNTVNYFLLHSDLVNRGVRFNNQFNQTIAQVLIDVAPGSQIVSTPFHPAKSNGQTLAGTVRTNLRFWLTDDQQRSVNTNGENWTARIVIDYLRPMAIGIK